jgi:glutaredoxin 3
MTMVEIYTKSYCPFCHRAKALLDAKGVSYREHEISSDHKLQDEMKERSGRHTVPQIFIDDQHIGGSDDLVLAQNSGLLDELLGFKTAVNI